MSIWTDLEKHSLRDSELLYRTQDLLEAIRQCLPKGYKERAERLLSEIEQWHKHDKRFRSCAVVFDLQDYPVPTKKD